MVNTRVFIVSQESTHRASGPVPSVHSLELFEFDVVSKGILLTREISTPKLNS
jgi:hypothetical protein